MDSLGVRNEEIWALRLKRGGRAEHYAAVCCGPFSWILLGLVLDPALFKLS